MGSKVSGSKGTRRRVSVKRTHRVYLVSPVGGYEVEFQEVVRWFAKSRGVSEGEAEEILRVPQFLGNLQLILEKGSVYPTGKSSIDRLSEDFTVPDTTYFLLPSTGKFIK